MVTYYNLTEFGGGDKTGYMNFLKTLSSLTNEVFPMFLVVIVFVVPLLFAVKDDKDVVKAMHLSSLYAMLLTLLFYVTEIITNSKFLYSLFLVYAVTAIIRWYHRD